MKGKTRITTLALIAIFALGTNSIMAQRPDRGRMQGEKFAKREFRQGQRGGAQVFAALDLTDEQQEQLKTLRLENQKDAQYEMAQLREKEAHLKTLLAAPERDKKAIEKTIDQISGAKGEMMKKRLNHQDEMKSILTDEQVQQLNNLRGQRVMMGKMKGQRGGDRMERGMRPEMRRR